MTNIYAWSTTAADNATADSSINWAEGMPPSDVNDSARVMMQRVKQFVTDIGGSLTTGGTANAITVTASSAFASYANGRVVVFVAGSTNTGSATLNVNSIGAKAVVKATGTGAEALGGYEIQSGGIYTVRYNTSLNGGAGAWMLINPTTSGVEPGMVFDYAGSTAPSGYLLCYGQEVSRSTYAALFAAISTNYGVGDGSTTFNLPDARGRVVAGKDDMGGTSSNRLTDQSGGLNGDTLGATGGAETHTLTSGQLAAHTHTVTVTGSTSSDGAHTHLFRQAGSSGGSTTGRDGGFGSFQGQMSTDGAHTHTISASGTTSSVGSGTAHNNVQPTIILNKIIKF
jgi:microcystin-dependent protein